MMKLKPQQNCTITTATTTGTTTAAAEAAATGLEKRTSYAPKYASISINEAQAQEVGRGLRRKRRQGKVATLTSSKCIPSARREVRQELLLVVDVVVVAVVVVAHGVANTELAESSSLASCHVSKRGRR